MQRRPATRVLGHEARPPGVTASGAMRERAAGKSGSGASVPLYAGRGHVRARLWLSRRDYRFRAIGVREQELVLRSDAIERSATVGVVAGDLCDGPAFGRSTGATETTRTFQCVTCECSSSRRASRRGGCPGEMERIGMEWRLADRPSQLTHRECVARAQARPRTGGWQSLRADLWWFFGPR